MSIDGLAVRPLFWRFGWALPWATHLRTVVYGYRHLAWRLWWRTDAPPTPRL